MVLALDALWFGVLILLLAIFCLAYLMSVRVWFALILVIIVVGLALTIVSTVSKKRRAKVQVASDETMLLEYLKSHGIGGNLSELAASLGIAEEKALKLLLSMEEQGTIPAGSTKAFGASPPDTKQI
jgi:type II secretory pathway pseudopilin PulG